MKVHGFFCRIRTKIFGKVAQVRNYLELRRHHPLMFFSEVSERRPGNR
jgi:hypothetical protein